MESLEDNHRTSKKVSKIIKTAEATIQKKSINTDTSYTIPELAKATGISISKVHFILKKWLHTRKISARLIPPLLSDDQKRAHVTMAKKNYVDFFPKFWQKSLLMLLHMMKPGITFMNHIEKLEIKFGQRKVPRDCELPGGQWVFRMLSMLFSFQHTGL